MASSVYGLGDSTSEEWHEIYERSLLICEGFVAALRETPYTNGKTRIFRYSSAVFLMSKENGYLELILCITCIECKVPYCVLVFFSFSSIGHSKSSGVAKHRNVHQEGRRKGDIHFEMRYGREKKTRRDGPLQTMERHANKKKIDGETHRQARFCLSSIWYYEINHCH